MYKNVTLIEHPLIQHKLTIMRKKDTKTVHFRQILKEISFLMGYEVTRNLELEQVEIETPLEKMQSPKLKGKKLCLVSILRAGNGFLDGLLDLIPSAKVGHIGLYRDHETLKPVEYYFKIPDEIEKRTVIAVDPMLATGNSAIIAIQKLKDRGAKHIEFMCLIAAPEGIKNFETAHPDVTIHTAAIDRELSDIGYILPGIGDAGDRMYGTI